jgi:hypothetical protein
MQIFNMAKLKTLESHASVKKFIDSVSEEQKRKDSLAILEMMKRATKMEPKMWGPSIIGFGSYHYKYDSGHEGDMCLMGFSPRKQKISLYLPGGHAAYTKELKQLGKYKTGTGCLYINKLSDVNESILEDILKKGLQYSASK